MKTILTTLLLTLPAGIALASGGGGGLGGGPTCGYKATTTANFDAADTATPGAAIKTKVAGSNFQIYVMAVKSNGTLDTSFNCDVTVSLLANQDASGATGSHSCPTNATTLASGTVKLSNGKALVSVSGINNAWRNVQIKVAYPYGIGGGMWSGGCYGGSGGSGGSDEDEDYHDNPEGSTLTYNCSWDHFAIRPASFNVQAKDATWDTAGTARTLNNTAESGGTIHKAGRPFTLIATAVTSAGATTTKYAGSPTASIQSCVQPSSGCTPGTLSTGAWSASNGVLTSHTASYSEVGTVSIKLVDSSFASIDANDGSTAAQRNIESPAFNIGRFVPDRFVLWGTNLTNQGGSGGNFTYMGAPFNVGFTLTAKNASGATTTNYKGALAHLVPTSLSNFSFGALDTGGGGTTLTSRLNLTATPTTAGWTNGSVTVNGQISVTRPTALPPDATYGPYESFKLGMAPSDEGVTLTDYDLDTDKNGSNDRLTVGSTRILFGRLNLANAHGPETLKLTPALTVQYWNGQGFVTNTADSTTTLAGTSTPTYFAETADNKLAAGETTITVGTTFASGSAPLNLSAPGTNNPGYLDLSVAAPLWLKFDWDGVDQGGDGNRLDDDPRARITFGKANRSGGRMIMRREVF